MKYTEDDLELYSIYMDYVRAVVEDTELPDSVKYKMRHGDMLHKINAGEWSLQNKGYVVTFMSFDAWKLCEKRDKMIHQLLCQIKR